jgi:isochorismate synthase EntC
VRVQDSTCFDVLLGKALVTAEAFQRAIHGTEDDKKAYMEAREASAHLMADPHGRVERFIVVQRLEAFLADDERTLQVGDVGPHFLKERNMHLREKDNDVFIYGLRRAEAL